MAKNQDLRKTLRTLANPEKAKGHARFFKTGPGEYGEGDQFLGLTVPKMREVAAMFRDLPHAEVLPLLRSRWHEERLVALFLLRRQFETGTEADRTRIFRLYTRSARYVNNWDLVDSSAEYIMGPYLLDRSRAILHRLARSKNIWERRMAVLATFHFIRRGDFAETLRLSEKLLSDEHDLMHKAVGWMLREVGKRDRKTLEKFLGKYSKQMPRTMLRYALEHFSKNDRKKYMEK